MKLASHNTMTYLPVRQWYLKPFGWMSKCQSKDLVDQLMYTDFIEIRVRFNKKGNPVFAHGLAEYKHDEIWPIILTVCPKDITVMVNLEWSNPKTSEYQEKKFKEYCANLEQEYPDIKFCGGYVKYDWHTVYKFKNKTPSFINYTASTTGNKIDDIWPWLFTKKHNKDATKQGDKEEYVRVDYIHTAK